MKSNHYRRSADRSRVSWQNALLVRLVGRRLIFTLLFLLLSSLSVHPEGGEAHPPVPILAYHRFGPVVADGMTVTTPVFTWHLQYLQENGYTVISLRQVVDWRLGHTPPPPPRSVVITVDDAHHSVYSQMLPLVQRYQVPVTLFVYPSAISHASYALRWEQLQALQATGLFDIQSHTYWHPNFQHEKKRLSSEQYRQLVESQLRKAKNTLESRLGLPVDLLS